MAEQGLYVGRLFAKYDIEGEEQAYADVERRLKQARGKFKLDVPVKVTGDLELQRLTNRLNTLKLEATTGAKPLNQIQREMREIQSQSLRMASGLDAGSKGFGRYTNLARQAANETNRLDRASKGLDFRSQIAETNRLNITTQQMLRTMTGLAGLLAGGGVAYGMAALGRSALTTAGDFEQSQVAFETLLGSAESADTFLKELYEFASRTPFEIKGLQETAKRMIAMGFEAEQVIPTVSTLGDAVAALGGDPETLARVSRAIGQINTKGRVQAEELLQLAEAGIPAYEILAEKLNLTGEEVANIGKLGLDADTVIKALLEGLDERFGGAMAKQANTLNGLISNVKDQWTLTLGVIGEDIAETFDVKRRVAAFVDFLEGSREDLGQIHDIFVALTPLADLFEQSISDFVTSIDDEAIANFTRDIQLIESAIRGLAAIGGQAAEILNRINDAINQTPQLPPWVLKGFGVAQAQEVPRGGGTPMQLDPGQTVSPADIIDIPLIGKETEAVEKNTKTWANNATARKSVKTEAEKQADALLDYQRGLKAINTEFAITGDKSKALNDQLKLTQNTFDKLIDLGYSGSQLQAFFTDIQQLSTQQAFNKLAEQGAESVRQAKALGSTVEAQIKSARERQELIGNMLLDIANGAIKATDAQIDYLRGRMQELTKELQLLAVAGVEAVDSAMARMQSQTKRQGPVAQAQGSFLQGGLGSPQSQKAIEEFAAEVEKAYAVSADLEKVFIRAAKLGEAAVKAQSDFLQGGLGAPQAEAAIEAFAEEVRNAYKAVVDWEQSFTRMAQLQTKAVQAQSNFQQGGLGTPQSDADIAKYNKFVKDTQEANENLEETVTHMRRIAEVGKDVVAFQASFMQGGLGSPQSVENITAFADEVERAAELAGRVEKLMTQWNREAQLASESVRAQSNFQQGGLGILPTQTEIEAFAKEVYDSLDRRKQNFELVNDFNAEDIFLPKADEDARDALKAYGQALTEINEDLGISKTQFESWRDVARTALNTGKLSAADFKAAMDDIAKLEALDTISTILTGLQQIASIDFSNLQSSISGITSTLGSIASIIPGIGPVIGGIIGQVGGLVSTVVGFFTGTSKAAAELRKETEALRDSFSSLSGNSFDKLVSFDGAKLAANQAGLDMAQALAQGFESGNAVSTFQAMITNIIRQAFVMSPEVQNLIVRWTNEVQRLMEGGLTPQDAIQLREMGEVYARAIQKSLDQAEALIPPIASKFGGRVADDLVEGFVSAIQGGLGGGDVAKAIQSEVERQILEGATMTPAMIEAIVRLVGLIQNALADGFISQEETRFIQAARDQVTVLGEAMQAELAKVGIGVAKDVKGNVVDPVAQSLEQAIRSGLGNGDVSTALRESVEQQILAGIVLPPEVLHAIGLLGAIVSSYIKDGFISAAERESIDLVRGNVEGLLSGVEAHLRDLGIGVSKSVKEKVTDPIVESLESGIRSGLGSGDVGEALRESVKQQILAGLVLPPEVMEGIKKMAQLVSKYIADGFISADEQQTINMLSSHIEGQLKGVQANLKQFGIGIKKEVKKNVATPIRDALTSAVRSGLGDGDVGAALQESVKQQILAGLVLPPEVLQMIKQLAKSISRALKDGFISGDEQAGIKALNSSIDNALKGVQANLRKLGIGIKKEVKQKVANPLKDALISGVRSGLGAGDVGEALKDTIKQQILAGIKLPREVLSAIAKLTRLMSKALKDGFISEAEQGEINVLSGFIDKALDGVQKNLQKLGIGIKKKVANPIKDSLVGAVRSGLGSGDVKTALKDVVKEQILAGLKLPPEVMKAISRLANLISKSLRDGFISKAEKTEMKGLNKFIDNALDDVQKNLRGMGIGIKQKVANPIKDALVGAVRSGVANGDIKTTLRDSVKDQIVAGLVLPPKVRTAIAQLAKAINNAMKDGFISKGEKTQINALENSINNMLKGVQANLRTIGIGNIGRNIGKEIKEGILGGIEQGLSGDMDSLIRGILSAELVKVIQNMPAMKKYAERAGKTLADLAKGGITEAEKEIIDRLAREGQDILRPYQPSYAFLNSSTKPLTGGAFGTQKPTQEGPAISLGFGSSNASVGISTQVIDSLAILGVHIDTFGVSIGRFDNAVTRFESLAAAGRFEGARAGGR